MPLSDKQLRFLRGRAHALKPVIQIGNSGLTAGVLLETRRALADHELIKLRIQAADRPTRDALLAELVRDTGSALVTRIGHVAVLFQANPKLTKSHAFCNKKKGTRHPLPPAGDLDALSARGTSPRRSRSFGFCLAR
jgi:RNA-binding protein